MGFDGPHREVIVEPLRTTQPPDPMPEREPREEPVPAREREREAEPVPA